MDVCPQTITPKVSHKNWCKVSKQKSWSYVLRQSPQRFHTTELVQSFTAKVMVVCRQTITAKVSHQNWCKVSQHKSWLYVVIQSPQKFHTRTGAKFHSKSHGHMLSDNHRKGFTQELVQSITAKVLVVCRQSLWSSRYCLISNREGLGTSV